MMTTTTTDMTMRDTELLPVPGTSIDLAKTCVTNVLYCAFVTETGTADAWPDRPVDDRPATRVSANEAQAYCAWLGRKLGREVRLPTDEEWSAAAMPDGRVYAWGNEPPTPDLCDMYQPGKQRPDPVGAHPTGAGAFGHLDLTGGVWEWATSGGSSRVFRGGCWVSVGAGFLRASLRYRFEPGYRGTDLGFRCARPVRSATRLERMINGEEPDVYAEHVRELRYARQVEVPSGCRGERLHHVRGVPVRPAPMPIQVQNQYSDDPADAIELGVYSSGKL